MLNKLTLFLCKNFKNISMKKIKKNYKFIKCYLPIFLFSIIKNKSITDGISAINNSNNSKNPDPSFSYKNGTINIIPFLTTFITIPNIINLIVTYNESP